MAFNESSSKILRKLLFRSIFFVFAFAIATFIVMIMASRKADKLIKADVLVETARLQSAVNEYYRKEGIYPEIAGFENNLSLIKSPKNDCFNFSTFYGTEQIYEIPENLKLHRERSNQIVTKKDKKGGWVYDKKTGKITPNIWLLNNKKYQ